MMIFTNILVFNSKCYEPSADITFFLSRPAAFLCYKKRVCKCVCVGGGGGGGEGQTHQGVRDAMCLRREGGV